jgi:hypothetical protein
MGKTKKVIVIENSNSPGIFLVDVMRDKTLEWNINISLGKRFLNSYVANKFIVDNKIQEITKLIFYTVDVSDVDDLLIAPHHHVDNSAVSELAVQINSKLELLVTYYFIFQDIFKNNCNSKWDILWEPSSKRLIPQFVLKPNVAEKFISIFLSLNIVDKTFNIKSSGKNEISGDLVMNICESVNEFYSLNNKELIDYPFSLKSDSDES